MFQKHLLCLLQDRWKKGKDLGSLASLNALELRLAVNYGATLALYRTCSRRRGLNGSNELFLGTCTVDLVSVMHELLKVGKGDGMR